MKVDTRVRKNASKAFRGIAGEGWLLDRMYQVVARGKEGMDAIVLELGRMLVEALMLIEREEIAGPDYYPYSPEIRKWASQPGSGYVGDQKLRVERPRLRGPEGEIELKTYPRLKDPGAFSEELLGRVLRGVSAQRYGETVVEAARAFGVSASSVSRHIVEVTASKLREFKERDLSDFRPFAIFVDTIHRGGQAFMVALGVDLEGYKRGLGFWEGASENHEVCEELLADLERRGLLVSKRVVWVTDGGKGIIKALRERFGCKLIHVRCMIHKSRNIQKHLAKRYRKEAHRRLTLALEQNSYSDAHEMLKDFEKWLRAINESAADSLREAFDEVLTLHRLKVPALLRKTLCSTNPIESMFSMVRDCERNVKRPRGSQMLQRWLASVLLFCEKRFHRVKGHKHIKQVIAAIETEQAQPSEAKVAA
ncbi:MAG: transposase [Candidatus Binatia bacterium]